MRLYQFGDKSIFYLFLNEWSRYLSKTGRTLMDSLGHFPGNFKYMCVSTKEKGILNIVLVVKINVLQKHSAGGICFFLSFFLDKHCTGVERLNIMNNPLFFSQFVFL